MPKKLPVIFTLMLFLVSGCMIIVSTDGELVLGAGEKWDLHLSVVLPADQFQLYGNAIQEELFKNNQENEETQVDIETSISEVDDEGNITVNARIRGVGYDLLNKRLNGMGTIEVIEDGGKRYLEIRMDEFIPGGLTQKGSTFTIKGGRILSSNGEQINAGSVKWVNAGTMQVRMEEPGGLAGFGYGMIVAGILCILFAIGWQCGWFHKKGNPWPSAKTILPVQESSTQMIDNLQPTRATPDTVRHPAPIEGPQPAGKFCNSCGAPLIANAKFCTRCGKQTG